MRIAIEMLMRARRRFRSLRAVTARLSLLPPSPACPLMPPGHRLQASAISPRYAMLIDVISRLMPAMMLLMPL